MATPTGPTPPIPFTRLKQIATDACQSAIGSADFYDHSKTAEWNSTIISSVLKAVISESTPQGASAPGFKFACNSTIVQHLVPTASLNKSKGSEAGAEEPHISTSSETPTATWQAPRRPPWHALVDRRLLGREEGRHVVVQVRWRRGQGTGRCRHAHLGRHLRQPPALLPSHASHDRLP